MNFSFERGGNLETDCAACSIFAVTLCFFGRDSFMATAPKKSWQDSYQLYIGGKWRDAEGGKTFDVYNPANGEYMTKCAAASKQDVDDAVKAAWAAFPAWKKTSTTERAMALT